MSALLPGATEASDEGLARRDHQPISIRPAIKSAILVILALTWLIVFVGHAGALDRSVFAHIYGRGGADGVRIAKTATYLGTAVFLYAAVVVIAVSLVLKRRVRAAALLIVIPSICRFLVFIQKITFALPRPNRAFHQVTVHTFAFPSGHSANSMATYLCLALILTKNIRPRRLSVAAALAIAFAIGISRIILGVHWPSDVIGGWAFGALWTVGGLWIVDVFGARTRASGRSQL